MLNGIPNTAVAAEITPGGPGQISDMPDDMNIAMIMAGIREQRTPKMLNIGESAQSGVDQLSAFLARAGSDAGGLVQSPSATITNIIPSADPGSILNTVQDIFSEDHTVQDIFSEDHTDLSNTPTVIENLVLTSIVTVQDTATDVVEIVKDGVYKVPGLFAQIDRVVNNEGLPTLNLGGAADLVPVAIQEGVLKGVDALSDMTEASCGFNLKNLFRNIFGCKEVDAPEQV
jgi:hypothetical protein